MDTQEQIAAKIPQPYTPVYMEAGTDRELVHGQVAQAPQPLKEIRLKGLPMPPSVNACYVNVPGRGRSKSEVYKSYVNHAHYWYLKNLAIVKEARAALSTLKPNQVLDVHYQFWFRRERLISKKGEIKKNDTANRLKPLDDQLATILQIDDSRFWHGRFEKIATEIPVLMNEWVDVVMRIVEIR